MDRQFRADGSEVGFNPVPAKSNGDRKDCIIDLEPVKDFGNLDMKELQFGQGNTSLISLRQMVKAGRPAVVIIMPPGMKFEASSKETFLENLKRVSDLRPIIMVFGGK